MLGDKEREELLKDKEKREERLKASSEWFVAGFVTAIVLTLVIELYLFQSVNNFTSGYLILIMAVIGLYTWKWSGKHSIVGGILRGMTIISVWYFIRVILKAIYNIIF
tara:strand:+ start:210 stop:533 length:324 start_codon:yes stop_codon:yes gene_type:complete